MTSLIVQFLVGIGLLYLGAEGLVRGSLKIAHYFGIKPFIIGLTVLSLGTSAPEFVFSLVSSLRGISDFALGNVVGSNIANIGLVLGIAVILSPIKIKKSILDIDYPIMLITSIIFALFCISTAIGMIHGILFLIGLSGFLLFLFVRTRNNALIFFPRGEKYGKAKSKDNLIYLCIYIIFILVGIVFLLLSTRILIDSGLAIAEALGVSEFAIAVTMVAVGTSLPEFATIIVSAVKKNTEIILGNIIGSNIFNILFVIGVVSVIQPILVNEFSRLYEIPAMLLFTIILFIAMRTGYMITRLEGIMFLVLYLIFLWFLFK